MAVDKKFNIKIETGFMHPNYNLDLNDQELIGDTGLLKVFELKPTDIKRPMFRGRWCRKDEVMDIDIINVSSKLGRSFKNNKDNCGGHHPDLIDENNRTFKVSIVILGENIFQCLVFFNINHTAYLETAHFGLTGYPVEFKIIRGPGNKNLDSDMAP